MSNLAYLGMAVLISLIGGLILYFRNRKPKSLESGIEAFRRELDALAPDRERQERDRRPRSG